MMRLRYLASALLLVFAISTPALAHEIRPIFLGLIEQPQGRVEASLKVPVFRNGDVAAVQPQFGPDCKREGPSVVSMTDDSLLERWTLHCSDGLAGQSLHLRGFSALTPDGLVSVRFADGRELNYAASRNYADLVLQPETQQHPARSLAAYVSIGVEHIALGIDHLLFVLGLILLWWRSRARLVTLIGTVTAFTVAHSLTLALSVLGGVHLPSAPVEALIALSILLLATELVRAQRMAPVLPDTLSFRQPWLIAFIFGLLHGFGFADALGETGLPEQARAWALLLFNIGVELGQVAFIIAAILGYRLLRTITRIEVQRLASPMTWIIGSFSGAWVLDRSWQIFAG